MWVNVVMLPRCPAGHQNFLWVMHRDNVHLNRVIVKSTPSGVTDRSMSIGWAVKTTLNHLAQGTELTEMKRIKVNPTLILGVDRGPFVYIYIYIYIFVLFFQFLALVSYRLYIFYYFPFFLYYCIKNRVRALMNLYYLLFLSCSRAWKKHKF